MLGIVAIVTKMSRADALMELAQMLRAVCHDSCCKTGTWIDESSGFYVAWARSGQWDCEDVPLRNEREDVVLMFSGEEFPDPGTAQRLRAQGHALDIDGRSYLVHLAEADPSFPAVLNGRFHGLLADQKRRTATLFNDRYGMHRLYYHESKDTFYFAGEAKAILAVRPELRRMDLRGLGEFISCGAVLENRTLFEGVNVLPPGSAWVFRKGSLASRGSYFQPSEWEEQETLAPESYYQELREAFTRRLPLHFDGPHRIAMSLTGGLDTRMILAGRKPDPGSLPCYTFGSMFRENQDVQVARRIAKVCGQSHVTITAGSEFLSQFSHYAERAVYLTDGCVDVSRSPDLYLNEKAREIAPIRMTGNYGGEILRGVRAFKPVEPTTGLFAGDLHSSVGQAALTYAKAVAGHPLTFAAFKQCPWYMYGVLALEETQVTMRSPYLDNEFVRTVFRSPFSAFASNDVSMRLIADGNRALLGIPTDRGVGGNRGRVAEAASHGLLEFLFKAEYAYDMGMPQSLARFDHSLSSLRLERLFLGRHKPFHFRVWYRDALAEYVREILLDSRSLSRGYISRKGMEAAVQSHLKGDRNYTNEIHKLLTLELVHRLFLDDSLHQQRRSFARIDTLPTRVAYVRQ